MPKKKTINDFISAASRVHNNKYDYSKVEYINSYTTDELLEKIKDHEGNNN